MFATLFFRKHPLFLWFSRTKNIIILPYKNLSLLFEWEIFCTKTKLKFELLYLRNAHGVIYREDIHVSLCKIIMLFVINRDEGVVCDVIYGHAFGYYLLAVDVWSNHLFLSLNSTHFPPNYMIRVENISLNREISVPVCEEKRERGKFCFYTPADSHRGFYRGRFADGIATTHLNVKKNKIWFDLLLNEILILIHFN